MSLLSVAQSEATYIFTSNLDTASTEATVKSPGSITSSTAFGTITAAGVSLTGNNSYTFGSDGYVKHVYGGIGGGGGYGAGALEIVFKKSSNPSDTVTLLKRTGTTIYGDGASLRLNSNGTVTFFVSGGQSGTITLNSTADVCDGNWHHVVGYYSATTSSLSRLFVDGVEVATTNTSVGNTGWGDEISVGASIDNSGNVVSGSYSEATIDFAAMYRGDLASPATFVANHMAEFANKVLAADPSTASALSVQPAISTEVILTVSPMTASSDFGNHAVSNFNIVPNLTNYLSTLTLEQWYRFNEYKKLTNYGNGGSVSANFNGNSESLIDDGVQFSGAIRTTGSATDGDVALTQQTASNALNPEINDANWVLGFWMKSPGKNDSGEPLLLIDGSTGHGLRMQYDDNGTMNLRWENSNGVHNIAQTTSGRLDNDKWHFIAIKYENDVITYYIDNVSQGTHNITGSYPTLSSLGFGSNNLGSRTGKLSISQFFIATTADVTSESLTNIYNYGSVEHQANARMGNNFTKFNSAFNDKAESYAPIFNFPLNDGANATATSDIASALSLTIKGTNYSSGNVTKNNRGWTFTNRDTYLEGSYVTPTGTFTGQQRQTLGVIVKPTLPIIGPADFFAGTGAQDSLGSGIGLTLRSTPGGSGLPQLNMNGGAQGQFTLTGSTYIYDGQYHFITGVKDGQNVYLYVDGKLEASGTTSINLTDSGNIAIGSVGLPSTSITGAAPRDTTVDEVIVYPSALTQQEVFELWQSISLSMETTATTELPMPTFTAGFGPIITANVMTAASDMLHPQHYSPAMLAFGEFLMPNYYAEVIINDDYNAEPMEASALFHDAQFSIGEVNSVDHMDASALMNQPQVTTPGRFTAPVLVGGDAIFVDPGIVTVKGAQVFASPMRSNAALPLPPAYITLEDDNWYVRLLQGHADKKIESVQQNLTNLPNQTTTDVVKGGFLSFFDDVLLDITTTTTINSISSEIPAHYFDRPGSYKYDTNGDLIPLDTTKAVSRASAPRASINPTPMMSVGYFDDQERKAVRVENIEFALPGTGINFSERPYNLEFSFKTTKANQIIAYGQWNSFLYYGRKIGVIGLFDGKIYLAEDKYTVWSGTGSASLGDYRRNVSSSAPHPKNFTNDYYVGHLLGRKRIDDGQWHHVVIQKGWTDNRTQIWIDGQLDRQAGVASELGSSITRASKGLDGTNSIRPYILGFNSTDPNLYSDFQTSAWNFYPGRFIEERDLTLNYSAYSKWEPIEAEPMEATIRLTDNNKGKGNRPRAIMLYWWETKTDGSLQHKIFDGDPLYNLDTDTFAQLKTQYNEKEEIQKYYGWDIFPIDILGRYQSPLIKEDVIVAAGYRDPVTGAPRYLDIVNDLDLSTIDAIFFRNYPDQTAELDEFAREEIADSYFGLKEKTLYENFINSLRSAMDLGINVYITNHQLAADLGIIENPEIVFDLLDEDTKQADPRSYDQQPVPDALDNRHFDDFGGSLFRGWYDTYKNNYIKVINEVPGITDQYGIVRDAVQMWNPSAEDWNLPFRSFAAYTQKQNLNVGDKFVISYATYTKDMSIEGYYAVHKDNVKAGIPITTFADTYWKGNVETENPYKDYVTSIALPAGTILNGRAIKSRVFVNFTERINGSFEEGSVELIQDEWIDLAFQIGRITATKRDQLKAATNNLDRRLEAAIADNDQTLIDRIQKLKYWDMNGMNMGSSSRVVQGAISDQSANSGGASGTTATAATSTRGTVAPQPENPTAGPNWGGGLWFKFSFYWQNEMMRIPVSTMLTRGFVWLSNRIIDDGTVNRTNVNIVNANMVMPQVVGDKDRAVYATVMLAGANIIEATEYTPTDVAIISLPFSVNATFGAFVKNITPDVMAAEARLRINILTTAVETDQVVVYVEHVDPILYIREEVIK